MVYWNTFGLVFTTEMHIVGPDHVDVDCVWQAKVKLIMHLTEFAVRKVIIKATASKAKKCPSSTPYQVFWQSIKISGILWSLEAELPRGRKFPAVVEDHGERVAIMGGLMLSCTNHYSSNCF